MLQPSDLLGEAFDPAQVLEDPQKPGCCNLEGFERFCNVLSAEVELDADFERALRGVWGLPPVEADSAFKKGTTETLSQPLRERDPRRSAYIVGKNKTSFVLGDGSVPTQ